MTLVTTKLPCSFIRRLGAVGYDAILLFAVWWVSTILVVALRGGRAIEPGNHWFQACLTGISYAYFVWQWRKGGQTLGMKAWRLRVCDWDGGPVGWGRASLRFLTAAVSLGCAGLGFLWCLVNHDALAWHDYLSRTRLFLVAQAQDAGGSESGNPAQEDEAGGDHQQRGSDDADGGTEVEHHA
jgi:uncharacterized RDD family membrane protein YckC